MSSSATRRRAKSVANNWERNRLNLRMFDMASLTIGQTLTSCADIAIPDEGVYDPFNPFSLRHLGFLGNMPEGVQ
jgi:hypothetical protein